MSTLSIPEPLLHHPLTKNPRKFHINSRKTKQIRLNYNYSSNKFINNGGNFCKYNKPHQWRELQTVIRASSSTETETALVESDTVLVKEQFILNRTQKVEGKISVRLDRGKDNEMWKLIVGCDLPGKWILHWGVNFVNDHGSEWDQPPPEMRPPGSIAVKDYAIETPLKKISSSEDEKQLHEVQIDFRCDSPIAAINFVLKDEESGIWCQYRGRDFKVPLMDYVQGESNIVGAKKGFSIWPGVFGQLSSKLTKVEGSGSEGQENTGNAEEPKKNAKRLEGFVEDCPILKEVPVQNVVTVSVRKGHEKDNLLVHLETDIPGEVIVHWGVCSDDAKQWEIPTTPYPPETKVFRQNALQTSLKKKDDGRGSRGSFSLDKNLKGFLFVLKLSDNTWLNHKGGDFYIPLSTESTADVEKSEAGVPRTSDVTVEGKEGVAYTDGIINDIRNLVSGISSEKNRKAKSKKAHAIILQEIEKLAAEAYNIFRTSTVKTVEEGVADADILKPAITPTSGTGSGYEILCQGFNWESHKSGRWYKELNGKAAELSALGFTVIWLPPPTESISPEGYMPRDLYNLNSRYGSMEDLKIVVKKFHDVGIKVLGDVVLNHRCAHFKNQNGVWNMFGGRMNWDDRAVVADDPHFQGRGNKSSGDNFHAAPNIDHSQDFVRKDLKEWLCWLREEIGYDGWRLDYVRGFWGGYVKDYLDASEPYFAVGEFWDSLSYTYGEMDHNQDAHRQRIIDWINAANGTAGAFDVTTKGILHAALERCEYWRLSDEKGKPPGVVGWWPSRTVTFIENHDTGSTQGHWRFPGGKEMQGYAYILTHPGTPSVFHDHIFSHYGSEIKALIALRKRTKINCRSIIKITKVERDVYAAIIDKKVAMKIGPGHYEPPKNEGQNWSMAVQGNDYKVWELST
ncbi:Alpha-amylase A type-3 [Ranunculus cassubicifolius]